MNSSLLALLRVTLPEDQKHYAGGSPLVEQEGWLANGSYTNDTPRLATGFHLHNQAKRKSRSHPCFS